METLVAVQDLAKSYRKRSSEVVRAVDGVPFEVERGVLGPLGPDGAGKTTTLEMIRGLIRPDARSVAVALTTFGQRKSG